MKRAAYQKHHHDRVGKRAKQQRPKVIYNTPGRECQHADKGCCPRCISRPTVRGMVFRLTHAEFGAGC